MPTTKRKPEKTPVRERRRRVRFPPLPTQPMTSPKKVRFKCQRVRRVAPAAMSPLRSGRKASIDLGLEVIEMVRKPGQRLTQRDLAEICGCSPSAIYLIELKALEKLRRAVRRRELAERMAA